MYVRLGSFELGTTQQKDEEKKRHTEKDLPRDNRIELEIYRRQKQDPFFRHYVQNEVKYFTDRISEGFMEIAQGFVPSDVRKDREGLRRSRVTYVAEEA